MSNTSKNIHLDYWIDMDLIGPAYTTDREDIIHCLMNKIVNSNDLGTGLFYETVFKSGKLIPLKKSNVVFFGKTYTDVSISQYISPEKCYLHESVGILAFRDFDNKLWVFDRFE